MLLPPHESSLQNESERIEDTFSSRKFSFSETTLTSQLAPGAKFYIESYANLCNIFLPFRQK